MKYPTSSISVVKHLWLLSSVVVVHGFVPLATSSSTLLVGTSVPSNLVVLQSLLNDENHPIKLEPIQSRRMVLEKSMAAVVGSYVVGMTSLVMTPSPAMARLEAVNRPDLLPREAGQYVIQTEKFLTTGQARRMNELLQALERDTGFRMRVLCQAYPNTPGLAIKDYWDLGKEGQKDDKYIVLVVDQFGGKSNILNFNVGDGVKFALPNVFWTRLSAKYGTTFYVRDNGMDVAITNAVDSIVACLRSEDGFCTTPPDEAPSMKRMGLL